MQKIIDIDEFLELSGSFPIIDVRAPKEFLHAHIPGAINIPLFDDNEREKVGKLYKQKGRDEAILCGLELVGPKLGNLVREAKKAAVENKILVHCWRGGMRSSSMAWLLSTAGMDVKILSGGYKTYRRYVKSLFQKEAKIIVLGGMTGSGKTEILYELKKLNEQVIDLEGIAHHKGSAFGALGQEEQCSTEQFENLLFEEWKKLDLNKTIWLEDESQAIGKIRIPEEIFRQIREKPLINIIIPKELRINKLLNEYGNFDKELLINSILKIEKRLGGLNTKIAIESIKNQQINLAIDISLTYYDKAYLHGLSNRDSSKVHNLELNGIDPTENANRILVFCTNASFNSMKPLMTKSLK
jgi:tRNA 2-selenouridine synthase